MTKRNKPSPWQKADLEEIVQGLDYALGKDVHYDPPKEVEKRYGPEFIHPNSYEKDPLGYANRMMKDFGLGPYQMSFNPNQDLGGRGMNVITGRYTPRLGHIEVSPTWAQKPETLAHELGHAADHTFDNYDKPINPRTWEEIPEAHHKYYRNFDKKFPEQLLRQRMVEQGWTTPVEAARHGQPWLRELNPQSSNKLPSPWSYLKDKPKPEDVELWNILHSKELTQDQ
jgi:hypothetical protein